MKKVISVLIAAAVILSCLPLTVFAETQWVHIPDVAYTPVTIYAQADNMVNGRTYRIGCNNEDYIFTIANNGGLSLSIQSLRTDAAKYYSTNDGSDTRVSAAAYYLPQDAGSDLLWQNNTLYNQATNRYIVNSGTTLTTSTSASNATWNYNNHNLYKNISGRRYYIRSYNWNYQLNTSSENAYMHLYEKTTVYEKTETGAGGYYKYMGPELYDVAASENFDLNTIEDNICIYKKENPDDVAFLSLGLSDENVTLTWDRTPSSTVEGVYTATVKYSGYTLGTVTLNVDDDTRGTYYIDDAYEYYTTPFGGFVIDEIFDNSSIKFQNTRYGTITDIPWTDSKVSYSWDTTPDFDEEGVYTLIVMYDGQLVGNIPVYVAYSDYPEYPNAGSVKVDKWADGENLNETGVADVSLSVTAIPPIYKRGVDVVFITDVSNSMAWVPGTEYPSTDGTNNKLQDMQQAVGDFVDILCADNVPGDLLGNNTVTFTTFGAWDADLTSTSYTLTDPTRTLMVGNDDASSIKTIVNNLKFTTDGDNTYYLRFDGRSSTADADKNYGGTNYDVGFMEGYNAVSRLKSNYQNALGKTYAQTDREIYVIFITDGAPTTYNGVQYKTVASGSPLYTMNYVNPSNGAGIAYTGDSYTQSQWYNYISSNPHGWATKLFNESGVAQMNAIGIDFQYGGFKASDEYWIFTEAAGYPLETVFTSIVAGEEIEMLLADAQGDLANHLYQIAHDAQTLTDGTNTIDLMGTAYDLQTASRVTDANGNVINLADFGITPYIRVSRYPVYHLSDVGTVKNGVTVTHSMIGQRYGTPVVIENITFNADGTQAYSDKMTGNILKDGLIRGAYVYYNTTDTDIAASQKTTVPAKSFSWMLGSLSEDEIVLSYTVYLNGSMQGERAQGTYNTNESATLRYINYRGHKCEKEFPVPELEWGRAKYGYELYLVDEFGKPVDNDGQEVSFADRTLMSDLVELQTYLNTVKEIDYETLESLIPFGYALYNPEASVDAFLSSGSNGEIQINDTTKTTHIFAPEGADENPDGSVTSVSDYRDVKAAFAVYKLNLIHPDVVVLDYGKPIVVYPLENDNGDYMINGISRTAPAAGVNTVDELKLNNGVARVMESTYGDTWTEELPLDIGGALLLDFDMPQASSGEQYIYLNASQPYGSSTNTTNAARYIVRTSGNIEYYAANSTRRNTVATGISNGYYVISSYDGNMFVRLNDRMYIYSVTDRDRLVSYLSGNLQPETVVHDTTYTKRDYVVYSPFKYMSSIDRVYYYVSPADEPATGSDTAADMYYSTITFIPATTVYYEDDFGGSAENGGLYIQYTGDWVRVSDDGTESDTLTANTDVNDRQDRGEVGQGHVPYGFDSSYADCAEFSNGSAARVDGSVSTVDGQKVFNAWAEFTFTGTGFDIISRTDMNCGAVTVYVTGVNKDYTDNPMVINKGIQELYQIPVISYTGLEYGTYKVRINVNAPMRMLGITGSTFYLDAIRIYDPMGTKNSENPEFSEANHAYFEDHEANAYVASIRDYILSASDLGTDETSGAVYVDTINNEYTAGGVLSKDQIQDFLEIGPNEEVYLTPGKGVGFVIECTGIPDSVQLEIKVPSPIAATASLKAQTLGSTTAVKEFSAASADEMFYDITDAVKFTPFVFGNTTYYRALVILSNGLENAEASEVISITNIKMTYPETVDNVIGISSSVVETIETASRDVELIDEDGNFVSISSETAREVKDDKTELIAFRASWDTYCDVFDTVYVQHQASVPNYDVLAADGTGTAAKGEKKTLTFTTSQYVDGLKVTDESGNTVPCTVTSVLDDTLLYTENYKSAKTWSVTVTGSATGENVYTVSAANGEGESAQAVLNVTAPVVTSLSVASAPAKTKYYRGEKLETAGLRLKAVYSDGTEEIVSGGYTLDRTSANRLGKIAVGVSYGGQSTSFNITSSFSLKVFLKSIFTR